MRMCVPKILLSAIFFFGMNCTESVNRNVNPNGYPVMVENFTLRYDQTTKMVEVKWDSPVPKPDFYLLLKKTENQGQYDTVRVTGDSTRFFDATCILKGIYFFLIIPYMVDHQSATFDTVQGKLSAIQTVRVGETVDFLINSGTSFSKSRNVKITINDLCFFDSANSIKTVRLTHFYKTMLNKSIDSVNVPFNYDDPNNVISNDSLAKYTKAGYLTGGSATKLAPKVIKIHVPVFDSVDGENPIRSHSMNTQSIEIPWVLLIGNGIKRIFAEVSYKNGLIDTFKADISIAPYQINVKILNSVGTSNAEMIIGPPIANKISQYFHKPSLRFAITIAGDSTFSDTFSYWLAFKLENANLDFDYASNVAENTSLGGSWVETRPEYGVLTGQGALHDENKEYVYEFDTLTEKGKAHLASLYLTKKGLYEAKLEQGFPFRITGFEHFNESALPGQYWGAIPTRIEKSGELKRCDSVIGGTYGENFKRLLAIAQSDIIGYGAKECVLIFRFKGKHFNDTRVVWSGSNGYAELRSNDNIITNRYNRLFIDFIPPMISWVSPIDPAYLKNGDTVSSYMDFKLNYNAIGDPNNITSNSAIDIGNADITKIELIIAEVPTYKSTMNSYDSLVSKWEYWNFKEGVFPNISFEYLLSLRHITIPYTISFPQNAISNVQWKDIDPTEWRAGRYFIAVATSDKWGNYGLAPKSQNKNETNPIIVNVVSGR